MTKDRTRAQKRLMEWAIEVFDTVHITCNAIHGKLMNGGALQGAIAVCGEAFLTRWRNTNEIPLDDRQYYDSMIAYLSTRSRSRRRPRSAFRVDRRQTCIYITAPI